MKKRILLFILALLPMMAWADESGTCGDNLTWTYVDATKTLTISGAGAMRDYNINGNYAPWYDYISAIQKVVIEEGVSSIGDWAFYTCSNLTSVTIPNSVTSIGNSAFYACSGLTSITIPNSVTSIGERVFYNCIGMTSITIPNSVTTIGERVFFNCTGLTSITIPNSVTSIGDHAFNGCTGLTSITIPNSVTSIKGSAFRDCSGLTSITIPNSVTSIGERVFYNCIGMTSITIPNSVTSIESGTFYNCSNLTSVTIPNSVTSIGDKAFLDCSGLTSVTIPNSVTSIGDEVFLGCSSLTSATIGNSVTSIGECAFMDCTGLTSITVESGNTVYDSRDNCNAIIETSTNKLIIGCKNTCIPNSVKSIGDGAFDGCTGLTSISIPSSVTSIGQHAFHGCTNLYMIVLPEGFTTIQSSVFQGCKNLNSITLPSTLTTIMLNAFTQCNKIRDVYCYAKTVDSTNGSAFDPSIFPYATLHVPASALQYYKSTAPWSRFGNIVALDGGDDPELKKCAKPLIYYSNGILSFESETEGAICKSTITDSDINSYSGNEVYLGVTYHISVYATKDGYENSDVATATLCWIDVDPQKEGITDPEEPIVTAVKKQKAIPVLIQGEGNTLTINGAQPGTPIRIFDLSGKLIGSATAKEGITKVETAMSDKVVIVKVGERSVKVAR